MKDEKGMTPLQWIVTIAVLLIIAGVSVAMIFGNEFELQNKDEQNQNTNENNTIQTETK